MLYILDTHNKITYLGDIDAGNFLSHCKKLNWIPHILG